MFTRINVAPRVVCSMCEWKRVRTADDRGSNGEGTYPLSSIVQNAHGVPGGRVLHGFCRNCVLDWCGRARLILTGIGRLFVLLYALCSHPSVCVVAIDGMKAASLVAAALFTICCYRVHCFDLAVELCPYNCCRSKNHSADFCRRHHVPY